MTANDALEWRDTCRKIVNSREHADQILIAAKNIFMDVATATLNKRLQSGYALVTPLRVETLKYVEVIESDQPAVSGAGTGSKYIQMTQVATIRRII